MQTMETALRELLQAQRITVDEARKAMFGYLDL
jgi:predicted kinase